MRFFLLLLLVLTVGGCTKNAEDESSGDEPLTVAKYMKDQNSRDTNLLVQLNERFQPIETSLKQLPETLTQLTRAVENEGNMTRERIDSLENGLGSKYNDVLATLQGQGDTLRKLESRPATVAPVTPPPSTAPQGSIGNLTLKSRKGSYELEITEFKTPATLEEVNALLERQEKRRKREREEILNRAERDKMMDALIGRRDAAALDDRVSSIDRELQEAVRRFESRQVLTQDGVTRLGTRIESLHDVVSGLARSHNAVVVDRAPVPAPTTGYIRCGHWRIFRRGRNVHVW